MVNNQFVNVFEFPLNDCPLLLKHFANLLGPVADWFADGLEITLETLECVDQFVEQAMNWFKKFIEQAWQCLLDVVVWFFEWWEDAFVETIVQWLQEIVDCLRNLMELIDQCAEQFTDCFVQGFIGLVAVDLCKKKHVSGSKHSNR